MKPASYVSNIQNSIIKLRLFDNEKTNSIKALGGRKALLSKDWDISYKNKEELAQILKALNRLGVCFVGSTHGWPPSEILAKLKEDGLLDIRWKEIVWINKKEYVIREKG
jgi:hypothetical protein